ncbi:MAG: hypothetical protein WAO91_01860 [Candidatus Nitrosotenuis sp.]
MSESKRCFVISPIGPDRSDTRDRSDQIFDYVIKPAVEKYGYRAIRADREPKPGMITAQIIQHIIEDELVIADLTGHNPNVFYELALRHAFGKPCIQIKEEKDVLPFDIAGMRTIDVDFRFVKRMDICKEAIIRQIQEIENNPNGIQTPLDIIASIKSIEKDDAQAKITTHILAKLQELNTNVQQIKSVASTNLNRNILDVDEEDRFLRCSHCKYEYLQLGKPLIHFVGDEYDQSNPQRTRGNWIEIPCQCESCNNITTINVSFHKGFIFPEVYPETTISNFENISRTLEKGT